MLYYLSLLTQTEELAFFRLFRYLTFRSGAAVVTALMIAFLINPMLIRWLKVKQGKGQPIRADGPARHIIEKAGTPTMGGILILIPWIGATLLMGRTSPIPMSGSRCWWSAASDCWASWTTITR